MKYEVSDDEDLDNDSEFSLEPLPPIDVNDLDFWENTKLA